MPIKRIVKFTFREDAVAVFLEQVFEKSKENIRAFPGCRRMELLQQLDRPHVLFTLSIWEDAAALEKYRQSELFQRTWAATRALFAEKAEAWSTVILDDGNPATLQP